MTAEKNATRRDEAAAPLSALAKGLTILESVVSHDRLSDIARRSGLSNSTVHRVLNDLAETGWVFQTSDRTYHPGRRLHALAGLLREDAQIIAQARPHLERLRQGTGMTVHFGLVKGDEIMYAAKLDGLGSYRMTSKIGAAVPMYSTGIGKSVLATLEDEDVLACVERTGMRPITSGTHTTPATLLPDLQLTRRNGWAIDNGENEEDLRCVAAAIFDSAGYAIGGVSVSALAFEMPSTRMPSLADKVTAIAREISSSLGAPEGSLGRQG